MSNQNTLSDFTTIHVVHPHLANTSEGFAEDFTDALQLGLNDAVKVVLSWEGKEGAVTMEERMMENANAAKKLRARITMAGSGVVFVTSFEVYDAVRDLMGNVPESVVFVHNVFPEDLLFQDSVLGAADSLKRGVHPNFLN